MRISPIGIAIDADRVVAVVRADGRNDESLSAWPWSLSAADRRESLARIFRELRSGRSTATDACIALLPPLAEARFLQLPGIKSEHLREALEADAHIHFPVSPGRYVVQVAPSEDRRPESGLRQTAIASEDVVVDIIEAARDAGLRVASLVPAHLAWAAAAVAMSQAAAERDVTVRFAEREDQLTVSLGGLVRLRRSRRNGASSAVSAELLVESPEQAAALAARFASLPDESSLWPSDIRQARIRRTLKRALTTALVSIVVFAAALINDRVSFARRAEALAESRRAVRDQVMLASATRDSMLTLRAALQVVVDFERTAPDWMAALAAVDSVLPLDASIISLNYSGDTLTLVARGRRAAPVLESFGSSRLFQAAWIAAPIQQEVENGEIAAERFTLSILLPATGPR